MRSALLVALIAVHAHAATAYHVKLSSNDPVMMFTGVRVLVDGSKVRADMEVHEGQVHTYDYALSDDGGKTWIGVNDELQTWFPLDRPPLIVRSRKSTAMNWKPPAVKKIQWSRRHGPGSWIGELSYKLEDPIPHNTVVRSEVRATAEVWPRDPQPAVKWPAALPFLTGLAAVDEQLARSPGLLAEFPSKIVVTFTRQYEGGIPDSETTTMIVDEVQELPSADTKRFLRPAGYREQQPVVVAPGR
ncbi:MAG TPA: hypothetical protein VKB93_24255 [Thermoanaerobaculia bacterium]|nr:hypothetical protein [Thermoanaerobaculia bacterium]